MPKIANPYYDRVHALADLVDAEHAVIRSVKHPVKFDMTDWIRKPVVEKNRNSCGTSACIAGLCQLAYDEEFSIDRDRWLDFDHSAMEFASHWLGLTDRQATCLFCGDSLYRGDPNAYLYAITRPVASAMLRNYAETGEMNWMAAARNAGLSDSEIVEVIFYD